MKRFCQIKNSVAWWIFEAEEMPEFSPEIVLKDISDEKYNEVQEGWLYDEETETFTKPIEPMPIPTPYEPTAQEIAEEALLETKYQTTLLELNS